MTKKEYKRKWYLENIVEITEKARQYRLRNPDACIKRLYGLTQKDWQVMFDAQEGCCKICKKHQSELTSVLHVDHDHTTGKIRGLLCKICNMRVGIYENFKIEIEEYLS